VEKIKNRIKEIKKELLKIDEMRPGSISERMTVCGRAGCRCLDPKKPKKHGPYYHLSYVHKGQSSTQFIQKELLNEVDLELKNYKKFKALTTEWVDLAFSIATDKLNSKKKNLKKKTKTKK
jgi:hypothetical protein